ncbi:MAG: DEAD/DEAH box helicase, partial [Candidatus Cloacimonetes bacterium]|nr:DEAD/DEAH box helicase [Candidatus Cloacimonadota bacterium]
EFDKENWEIEIEDELKNEFIYRITLNPIIKLKAGESIEWFSYELSYEFTDLSISQDELRKYFKSGEKFLKTKDGQLVFINNKEVFDEIEDIIKKSQKDKDQKYRAYLYKLPWIYQLTSINPAIKIYGDDYLDEMYQNLLDRKLSKTQEISLSLRAIMRSYQKSGFAWIKMLEKYRLNGILADDMGLGKTLQAISIIASHPQSFKHLIICPKTLLYNWANEFDKFAPHISYLVYEGLKEERHALLENMNVQVVLASYAIIQNDLTDLEKFKFHYVIIDEAQHIKNPTTLRAKAIKKLNSVHKLALTGTPLENNIVELWSIFDFLMPGYLPSLPKFRQISTDHDASDENNPIQRYISPFILRRKKQDVLIELPDKQEQTVFCKMSEIQEQYYVNILNSVKQNLVNNDKDSINYIHLLAALTRLRQICDHPYLIDRDVQLKPGMSGKVDLFEELAVDAFRSGKKFLIFSQYISMLEILRDVLGKNEIPFEYLDGSTQERQKVIDRFNNNDKIRAFLISLKTGGYGINLTAADTVFIIDPWWNPMVENQAIDRAYRIGQTKKVNVYKLITKGTVEEKIMLLQQNKKDLFDYLIEGGDKILSHLSINELKNLFDIKNE